MKNIINELENATLLKVGGSLDLEGSSITSLPEGLKVGGSLYLAGSAIPKVSSKGGEYERVIYAFLVGNKVMVTAGCFYGTPEEFYEAVSKKYGESKEGEEYKGDMKAIVEKAQNL